MPTTRTPLKRRMHRRITQAAIDAWKRGDVRGVHAALGLAPWQYSPVPERFGAYGLPDEQPEDPRGCVIEEEWPVIKLLQDELYEIAGEPGVDALTTEAAEAAKVN